MCDNGVMSKRYKQGCENYYKERKINEEKQRKLEEKQRFKIGNEITPLDRLYDVLEILGLIIIVLALIALTFK